MSKIKYLFIVFLLTHSVCYADVSRQSPSSAVSKFSPSRVSSFDPRLFNNKGLQLWYDGFNREAMTLDVSNNVTLWNDKSINRYSMPNVDATPNWSASLGVTFNSGDSINRTAAAANVYAGTGANTLFIFGTFPDVTASNQLFPTIMSITSDAAAPVNRRPLVFMDRANDLVVNSYNSFGGAAIAQSAGTKLLTSWTDTTSSFIGDGTLTNTSAITLVTGGNNTIISFSTVNATNQDLSIAEALFFNVSLTLQQIANFQSWANTLRL